MYSYGRISIVILKRRMFESTITENQNTPATSNTIFSENRAIIAIMWENMRETDRPQMTIRRICCACWINKATDTHPDYYYYFLWLCSPARGMASSFTRYLDHTQRRATVSRTPLDEWSARRRDLYLTTHNRQTSRPPVGFETMLAVGERP
jgi:hypothetical protein